MDIIRSSGEMQEWSLKARSQGLRIGFVPTMGYLHAGHTSLARIARHGVDRVVVSIFVNPLQFGPNEDYGRYPRDFARDEALCREAGVDVVFYPEVSDLYAPDHSVFVVDDVLSRGLCGASRPGHFRGVTTVVAKLFNLVLPNTAVFGEKDAQQLRIIRRMVRDLNFPIDIIPGPTVRESDGLAMSSRNILLSPEERRNATCLRKALDLAEKLYRDGERNVAVIQRDIKKLIESTPGATIDYVELVDDESLSPVLEIERPTLVALAVKFAKTRLIDNAVLR